MFNFSDSTVGQIEVKVKVNGEIVDRTIDLYEAYEFMQKSVTGIPEGELVPGSLLRTAAVNFFKGVESDWTFHNAGTFWQTVVEEIEKLKKPALDTTMPS